MMRKPILILALIMALPLVGCATPFQWTPNAQVKADAFGAWADKWVGGALANAPAVIMIAGEVSGQQDVARQAIQAVTAAQSALGAYHAVVAAGVGDPQTATARVLNAIEAVNKTVSEASKVANP